MDKLTARQADKAPRLAEELNSIHSFEATHYLSAAKGLGVASLREDLLSRWATERRHPDKIPFAQNCTSPATKYMLPYDRETYQTCSPALDARISFGTLV